MEVAYISALSALAGSVVGGLSSTGTTWLTQRAQVRAMRLERAVSRREDLYRDFIVAASKAYGEALTTNELRIADLVGLYAMVSQMRAVSPARTAMSADRIMLVIIDTHFSPNKSVRELRELIKQGGAGIDPLKEFSEAVREELQQVDSL
jgi:hypothetical protein